MVMCSERLIELIENDNIQMAKTLAIGIRQNDTLIDIKELDGSVRIEFNHFVGIHSIKIVDNGKKVINAKGIYYLKSNQVNFEMKSNIRKDILRKVYKEINGKIQEDEKNIIETDEKINRKENNNMNLLTRFLSLF